MNLTNLVFLSKTKFDSHGECSQNLKKQKIQEKKQMWNIYLKLDKTLNPQK